MKKVYETPKVEKMAFNYSDAVVASNGNCHTEGNHGWNDMGCESQIWNPHWVGDNT